MDSPAVVPSTMWHSRVLDQALWPEHPPQLHELLGLDVLRDVL